MDSNRGWDTTSDEDDGMEIDLDSKQEDTNEDRRSVTEEQDLKGHEMSQTDGLDYDPAEPTDEYDPSEPTPEEGDAELCRDTTSVTEAQGPSLVADYDPADPTLSDEEKDDNEKDSSEQAQPPESKNDEEDSFDGRWNSQLETLSPEDIPLPKDVDSGSEFAKDEGTPTKDEITKHHDTSQEEDENRKDEESTVEKMTEIETGIEEGSRLPTESRSPSPLPTDTDENTQMSFADGANSDVPEVTIDESDFVLEKELFEPAGDQNNSLETDKSTMESENQRTYEGHEASQDGTISRNQESRGERVEKTRTQEEVDSRNEEALVDLFREESDPDRLENDLEQPLKKTKKKVGTKKLKKKGKKLKKGQNKKGQNKDVEDQRFVELRGDRQSIESQEEGEVDAGGHGNSWADLEDRLAPGKERSSEQLYDVNQTSGSYLEGGDDTEQREPGEIVEESMKRKSGKKRDREKKRKKKSKREVATIEEGALGDEDSQKFPSFLAGFFVQDEDVGEEDLADKIENMSHSFEAEEERTFQKGGKTYRKRHDSGAEDSVKSGEEAVAIGSLEARVEEADHRKGRSHDERQHGSRERRHEGRDGRDGRREKENRHAVPREKEREKARDRDRSRHDRERVRDRENRDREVVRERDRERDRSRRGEREERRRRHTSRSGSRERRRRSGSAERNWRSRSRDRSVRHRRHRSRSQERDRERERARRSNRERSRERESERRGSGRRGSRSRSRSPRHRSERGSSNKENREDSRSSRRRVVSRTQQEASGSEEREGSHRMSHRRQQREKERDRERQRERSSSSSSSSSSNSSGSSPSEQTENTHRQQRSHRDQYRGDYPNDREHHHHRHHHHNDLEPSSSDEGASSDVILVEPEKIVINLDEEEDPPSRVDITLANAEDDSTTMVDGESIPPPPDLTQTTRASALIEITQEAVASSALDDQTEGDDQEEGDATPTRDERSDKVSSKQPQRLQKSVQDSAAEVGDYDPAHPTEEGEDKDCNQPPIPVAPSEPTAPAPPLPTEQAEDVDSGPVPPSHPPPQEIRPSPPPVPAMPEPSIPERPGLRPQPSPNQFPNPQFSQPQPPIPLLGQQPLGFPPAWNVANRPNGPNMSGFNNQRGLLPTPDIQPLFPLRTEDSRQQTPFSSQQGRREQQSQNQPPVPISSMAPLAQLHSLLPALERAKMSSRQTGDTAQGVKEQSFHVPPPAGAFMKAPLMSNPAQNIRPPRGGRGGGGDLADSTEVVDMDMSPGEDDCELELPSPHSSDSDREERRRKGRKSDTRSSRTAGNTGGSAGKPGGPIQPVVYLKALKKVIEKMTPKGQPAATGGSSQEKGKPHERRRRRPVELTAEDDVPTSAVELTNKEKYLKKLHLQERVIDEVKLAIKPFYSSKKINKEQYKLILRKAVPKVCHSKSERINPQKIQQLVEAYVGKLAKGSTLGGKPGGHSGKKKKASGGPPNKDTSAASAAPHGVRQNGERGKKPNR